MGSCNDISKPSVDETAMECENFTSANCVVAVEPEPYFKVNGGDTLTKVVSVIAKYVKKLSGRVDGLARKVYNVTRPIDSTPFVVSTTKSSTVHYNINIACVAEVGADAEGGVLLQYSTDAGANWVDCGELKNSISVSVAPALTSSSSISGVISWEIPIGASVRISNTISGNATVTYVRGQEVY